MTFYHFARSVVKGLLSPLYRIEVKGLENFPESGGVLLCTNHISNLDPPVVGITCPRPVSFMAKEELFRVPVLKSILPNVKAFPVKRGMSDRGALRTGLALLKEGEVLGLFPEGTRSKTGEIGKGLAGAGFFALRSDAKIIPCAIIGPYKLFGKLRVVYGKPIDFTELKKEKISVEAATEIIMNEIKKLTETH
ncbi:1-acyl-sn-glycerol-3-phosphate acyltransferase [Siminovitchia terrae]|uniref:1-acyl-sn-glycerol-3-phosphate acyltransferase n=1 Tax=Siminovitchia terrae TaxID=1914933 RepID=A0A429X499_SIMTE|nr:lysophospholipid acyltransferase family protein [Siminovitchia terrae]RST58215.1 1-acyl-sn-glycerol-3-phosphate acyltransferase [Siminovitchia terrae]GIN92044.1 1-acyl-sn-glycerol-3-phosphate acyltransferase [Siminovitchia terrae]GIN96519.1 1-acyl-sn-glycerol-3-phosphate acyltransferase [Siminovitchia terrae]